MIVAPGIACDEAGNAWEVGRGDHSTHTAELLANTEKFYRNIFRPFTKTNINSSHWNIRISGQKWLTERVRLRILLDK